MHGLMERVRVAATALPSKRRPQPHLRRQEYGSKKGEAAAYYQLANVHFDAKMFDQAEKNALEATALLLVVAIIVAVACCLSYMVAFVFAGTKVLRV